MKYAAKREFVDRVHAEHNRFLALADEIGADRFNDPGVWGEGWNVKDLSAHLTEWEHMFLSWHRAGLAGETPNMPAPGYKWNETPRLNLAIREKHKNAPWTAVRAGFDRSFAEITALIDTLSEHDILEPGRFAWTGRNALITYPGANTASHDAAGRKILKRHIKG